MEADLIDTLKARLATLLTRAYAAPILRSDFDPSTMETVRAVREFTATSPERIFAACEAIRYVSRCAIQGDIVECGVWRGGMVMAMLRTLTESGDTERDVYLYDTFAGMSQPTARDRTFKGTSAASIMSRSNPKDPNSVWCANSIEEVRKNVATVGYDSARIHFVEGKIEETLPAKIPEHIAVLRLDTDWYASTKHELIHLYPRLSSGGVLMIDDYGHWKGAREAVDEYIAEHGLKIMLGRTDYTGRIAVKP